MVAGVTSVASTMEPTPAPAPALLPSPRGPLGLVRWPHDPRDQLRAWDAADALLLEHLAGDPEAGRAPVALDGAVVVLGDRWGALAVALADHEPHVVSDSLLAQLATARNLAANGAGDLPVHLLTSEDELPERIDVLLVRLPRTAAVLEHQLHRIAPRLAPGAVVVGAGMVKEVHTSTSVAFERLVGPTRTSLAKRKARLVHAEVDPALVRGEDPWPRTLVMPPDAGALAGLEVVQHAGVFSAEHLDVGTRFLLEHLPERSGPELVLDLGCGNGVVGVAAALANPAARVLLVDESHAALASARETVRRALGEDALVAGQDGAARASFAVADVLVLPDGSPAVAPGSVDLVLNNPPFHSQHAVTGSTARRMFTESHTALRRGGELWVVGNRHLDHRSVLERIFGGCRVAAAGTRFTVLRAVKR